ncbi:mechanosensitive ion channel domain-containing protein [Lutimaribacter marinistellae]|uniref:Small-conductance mechanosensitive channel n=1 Tax=Lutimaribacter marinistellae TaxID=1820329 RepID=A0ABV7TEX7_9RHOB
MFPILVSFFFMAPAWAQESVSPAEETGPVRDVAVAPEARDEEIDARITQILNATGWFVDPRVRVDDGIVFLDGLADSEDHRVWARDLAAKTQDVVAVVNRIQVEARADWSFAPAFGAIRTVIQRSLAALPLVVLTIVVLPLAWWISSIAARGLRRWFLGGLESQFLRTVVARALALPIFLLGLYVVMQAAGLTQIAFSLIGGAGIIGIIVGFAFRDIAENFLASLLLSLRQPFRAGDLIDVDGRLGSVHSMNTRSTVLISPEGNHIQIPNATVFKSVITNFTAAPEGRDSVTVGIGYDAAVTEAQEIVARVLSQHEAVLNEPPPMVLVEALGASTVNLRAYYWINVRDFSMLKVKSSVLRLMKKALMDAGISMPDDAREIIFPEGVPVLQDQSIPHEPTVTVVRETPEERTAAEASLENDQNEVVERATRGDNPEQDGDLLR